MHIKFIIIVHGEPFSTFSEILGKYFSKIKRFKKKIIIIGNIELIRKQLKKLNYFLLLNEITDINNAKQNVINIININFSFNNVFSKISPKSNLYIKNCFAKSLEIMRFYKKECILINGPVSKKTFLKKKYLGVTEYLSEKTKSKNEVMLIYNEKIAVTPITTHIPLKYVAKQTTQKKIINNILKINYFYKNILRRKTSFAVLGLNPHCETIDKHNEENKIIKPSIKLLRKKKINIEGPFPADTFFLKKNIDKYDVVVGMYHDQVLTPIKTIFNFNAINLTIGLPFIRISPDHGPNSIMLGKNKSDPSSFMYAMKFIEKLK